MIFCGGGGGGGEGELVGRRTTPAIIARSVPTLARSLARPIAASHYSSACRQGDDFSAASAAAAVAANVARSAMMRRKINQREKRVRTTNVATSMRPSSVRRSDRRNPSKWSLRPTDAFSERIANVIEEVSEETKRLTYYVH